MAIQANRPLSAFQFGDTKSPNGLPLTASQHSGITYIADYCARRTAHEQDFGIIGVIRWRVCFAFKFCEACMGGGLLSRIDAPNRRAV